jgi:gliding-associated putative ABC transporter substrate-binding component GldG
MVAIKKSNLKNLILTIGVLLIANGIGNTFFNRFDLTSDKRYTLSDTSLKIIEQVKEPLAIKIYMQGELPPEFKRLQQETQQLLEEFQSYNKNIVFTFVDPLENEDSSMNNIKDLYRKGLTPVNITVDDKGKQSQAMVFPLGHCNL